MFLSDIQEAESGKIWQVECRSSENGLLESFENA